MNEANQGDRIPSAGELMANASVTTNEYLHNAIDSIDKALGEGYAKSHPDLLAAMVQAAALDFLASVISTHLSPAIDALAFAKNPIE